MPSNKAIDGCLSFRLQQVYRRQNNGQISIEEFYLPFGGTLDPENRWVRLEELMPWDELEETYAAQFSATVGAPAKSVRVAFGALYIKQKLGLADEDTVNQIRENAYTQYFLGFAAYVAKAPFDPSMMVHFRKRFSDDDIRRINELVVQRGKDMLLKALAERSDDNESDGLISSSIASWSQRSSAGHHRIG